MVALDTPIPTPSGWTTMGEIAVGDEVFDESGKVCRVTFVSIPEIPDEAYRVAFADGTSIDACGDHQWVTWTHAERKAFLRSPYEDTSRFPDDWVNWRLSRRLGGRDLPREVIEAALALSASGMSARKIAPKLGVCRQALDRHLAAGVFVERLPVIHDDAPGPRIRTTREIVDTLTYGKRGDRNHCIPHCQPFDLPDAELPIPPYTLGAWLGDGASADGSFTCHEDDQPEMRRNLEADGFPTSSWDCHSLRFGTRGLRVLLRLEGLLNNKHVPPEYLRASAGQRLALLRGLMDTDGGIDGASHGSFTSTRKCLVDGVEELVVSPGMRALRDERPARLKGKECGTSYRVSFTPTIQVFTLRRKAQQVRFNCGQQLRRHHRMIVSAESITPRFMRCISVDSPNHMYLAGRACIPTHNTRCGAEWVRDLALRGPKGIRIAKVAQQASDVRDIMIDGESGILAISPPWFIPEYSPTKRRLTWPNGAQASCYSSEEPRQFRGPHFPACWEMNWRNGPLHRDYSPMQLDLPSTVEHDCGFAADRGR